MVWKNVRPLCYAMSIPTNERDTMFTLTNPMKVMNERYVVTSLPCPDCGTTKTVSISSEQLFAYNQGGYAQDVLKDYDAGIRERFISGMCNDCFCTMNNFASWEEE